MYLIWPRYEISAETGYTIPYTGKFFYTLVKNRDQSILKTSCSFFICIGAELGFIALSIAALIESLAHLIFGAFAAIFSSNKETERRATIISLALLTTFYSLYSVVMNLFVWNLTSYVFSFDLFLRPFSHQSIFLDACRTGNIDAAKKFSQMGLDPHERNSHGITPALLAHIYGYEQIEKLFPCNTYEQEYLELKLLSHWLNIPGNVTLNKQKIDLQGAVSNWMFYSIGQALSHFRHSGNLRRCFLSPQKGEKLEQAFLKAYHPRSSKEIADCIQSGELCVLDAGWEEHAVCLVFKKISPSKAYLAICNRGEGTENFSTLEVFCIDPNFVTEKIIEDIKTFSSRDTGLGLAFLYHALPGILSPTGDPSQDEICLSFKTIAPKFAKMGNCTLTAKKAALRFGWVISLNEEPDTLALKQGKLESKIFTDWAANYYFHNIKPYDKFHGLKAREDFLSLCKQSALKKKQRYKMSLKDIV